MNLSVAHSISSADYFDKFFACDGKIGLLYSDLSLTRLALYGITMITTDGYAIWVLDGANSFNAYVVARLARRWGYAPEPVLERVELSRAFTWYQMKELVTRRLASALGPPQRTAIFCLGLLETFFDEDVKVADAVRMIKMISATFTALAQRGYTILITAREPCGEQKERLVLLIEFCISNGTALLPRQVRCVDARPKQVLGTKEATLGHDQHGAEFI